ncbi:hypothetical protein NMY22_g11494 [Coprinellus aureogranulatus]|nr:hypothetical protein NMY22_g11494 [Coprinellus aureogranulatus]
MDAEVGVRDMMSLVDGTEAANDSVSMEDGIPELDGDATVNNSMSHSSSALKIRIGRAALSTIPTAAGDSDNQSDSYVPSTHADVQEQQAAPLLAAVEPERVSRFGRVSKRTRREDADEHESIKNNRLISEDRTSSRDMVFAHSL